MYLVTIIRGKAPQAVWKHKLQGAHVPRAWLGLRGASAIDSDQLHAEQRARDLLFREGLRYEAACLKDKR